MNLVRLEKAQQLGLHLEAGVADLIEEQRATGRGAHHTLIVVDGAGERSAAVAEQLRIEHILGVDVQLKGRKVDWARVERA